MATRRTLNDGELLFSVGDDGDTVFELLAGGLEVVSPTVGGDMVVATLGAGDIVGEIAAMLGSPRTATVRAAGACDVAEMDKNEFANQTAGNPGQAERLAALTRQRVDRTRVVQVISELLGPGYNDLVLEIADDVAWVRLDAGETLFEQGDPADAAYILVSGQMRVTATEGGSVVLNASIGRGDLLGEAGIVEDAPRSASARATRDCTLARLDAEEFRSVIARHPTLMLPLVRKILRRTAQTGGEPVTRSIAVVMTCQLESSVFATLRDEIGVHGSVAWFDPGRASSITDTLLTDDHELGRLKLNDAIHEADLTHDRVVMLADDSAPDWLALALRSADRIVVVSSSTPDRGERARIEAVRAATEPSADYDLWQGVVSVARGAAARNTASLRALSGAHRGIVLNPGDEQSIRRFARLITGNGTGVALGGGGARSFAQLGALAALLERGHTIDAIAGTSMGSVVAARFVLSGDIDYVTRHGIETFTEIKLLDWTVPVCSIYGGRRISSLIEDEFGNVDIEDMPVPFCAMSTNLTTAEVVEHHSGPLGTAIRASVSLPGVFPPVVSNGDLLVDGGVLQNLPVDPLRNDPGIKTIIAIDVTPPGGMRAPDGYDHGIEVGDIARGLVRRRRNPWPALAQTVVASMLVGSAKARQAALDDDAIDIYLSLNLSGIKLFDFASITAAIERGRAETETILDDLAAGEPTAP